MPSYQLAFIASMIVLPLTVKADETFQVSSILRHDNALTLSWEGGQSPFEILRSHDLTSWESVGTSLTPSFTITNSPATAAFFRVSGEESLGEYVGQWRIAEGEFGQPLAKHRLKSLWNFYRPDKLTPSAKSFFTEAMLQVHYLEGSQTNTFTGTLADLPEAVLSFDDQKLTVDWQWGEGEWKRAMTLTMNFRYNINGIRFQPVNLSDPTITLSVVYEAPKPSVGGQGEVSMIREEEAGLVEVDDQGERPNWWNRSIKFTQGGVTIDSKFSIGVPLIEGGPAFIFKTPLLVGWEGTTIAGLTTQPITLSGRFAQTYYPFHHNFVETLWLEPALEPGIDPTTLEELETANIRFIIPQNPSAFPEQDPTLRVMGFDNTIRSL